MDAEKADYNKIRQQNPPFRQRWRNSRNCCLAFLALPIILSGLLLFVNSLPTNLSPEEAHYDTEKWVGREVRIVGTLRLFQGSTGPHYGIEDSAQNRVGIRDYDTNQLEKLIGQRVIVEGKFQFDQQYGIYVVARSVKVI